ncbi:MAG: hypothetical protein ABSD73_05325 [Candidatus Bathyarchaeia archaeon]
MKRKALALLLVVVVVVLAYVYTIPPTTVLSIDAVYNVDQVGQTVLLTATLKNVPSVGEWVIAVSWDPYIAQVTTGVPNGTAPTGGGPSYGVIEGPFLKDVSPTYFVMNYMDNQNGTTLFGCLFQSHGTQISGTGVIFWMNFTIIHVGTTTLEIHAPFQGESVSLVKNGQGNDAAHVDVNGLITGQGPPPAWTDAGFQETVIASEILVLAVASSVVYLSTHKRPPKSLRRKAELQPVIEPEDQR